MSNFNIGDEVIFKNYRLVLDDVVTFTDKFTISSGRINDCYRDEEGVQYYLVMAVNPNFSIDVFAVPVGDVIRSVSSLDILELSK